MTSEYGDATTAQVTSGTAYSLPISDQVTYLTYPAGDTLTVGPTEAYGTNLAPPPPGPRPPPRAATPRPPSTACPSATARAGRPAPGTPPRS